MKPSDYVIKEIKENRNKPRIFLDGRQAARAGFAPGDLYVIEQSDEAVPSLTLIAHKDGSRTVSSQVRTVSGRVDKKTGQKTIPVIDLNSDAILGLFKGMTSVRMIVRPGSIIFIPLASELSKKERLERLTYRVQNKLPIRVGDITHGVGVMADAIHRGLHKAGLETQTTFINEIREDLIEHSRENNPVWSENTISIAAPMQELVQDEWMMGLLGKCELFMMSLPCSGASQAGATKNELQQMEDHVHVGHLVFAALTILSRVQPAAIVLENVSNYSKTASASILRKQLTDMGYNLHEGIVKGKDYGCIENRVRWCMVATTQGLDFDFDSITPPVSVVQKIEDIKDDVPLDSSRWKSIEALKRKEARDIEQGKGFRLPLVNDQATSVPTIRKQYQKRGSCDVQLVHPTDPNLARLFTGDEHLRIKGINPELFNGLSDALKHQGAGQAVQQPPFEELGRQLGESMHLLDPIVQIRMRLAQKLQMTQLSLLEEVGDLIAYEPVQSVAAIAGQTIIEEHNKKQTPTLPAPRRMKLGGGGIG